MKEKKGKKIMYRERIRDLMNAVKDEPEDLEFIEAGYRHLRIMCLM